MIDTVTPDTPKQIAVLGTPIEIGASQQKVMTGRRPTDGRSCRPCSMGLASTSRITAICGSTQVADLED